MARQSQILVTWILLLMFLSSTPAFADFKKAVPVWPEGRATEMNLSVGFRATVSKTREQTHVTLRVTGSTIYRAYVNGKFAGAGPARAGHAHYRVDEWDLTPHLIDGENVVAIEVAGYNANSYCYLDQPSFLQAEILVDGAPVAYTAEGTTADAGFVAYELSHRRQKVQRISFQRTFTEAYEMHNDTDKWRTGKSDDRAALSVSVSTAPITLIDRRITYPDFRKLQPVRQIREGAFTINESRKDFWADRALVNIGPNLKGYPQSDLELTASRELQKLETATSTSHVIAYSPDAPLSLAEKSFRIFDFGRNLTGFTAGSVTCTTPTRLAVSFDERMTNEDVDFLRLAMVNAIIYDLQPGTYNLESFEPYTFRFLKMAVLSGGCEVSHLGVREYSHDGVWQADFACSDVRLNRLFEAGRETYRQNSVDVFMDCPSRERAGWLCDSFFTARASRDLTGSIDMETNFLENFLHPKKFEHLPDGMLPMCYPADHPDGIYIPNWAMWFVIQLKEYADRGGDAQLVAALKPRVMALLKFFEPLRNSDGLLEKLPSWVFVEWSKAAEFTQDVNYPSNMLYAGTLQAAGELYNDTTLIKQANAVRETIRKQSFDGEFFVDNAVRKDGKLEVTKNRSEVCQYYAFFFDVATTATHQQLFETLRKDFGPHRKETKAFPEVHFANAFVGNILRLEVFSKAGLTEHAVKESLGYYDKMAEESMTLWEMDSPVASLNHGYASHICHLLYRDLLGVTKIDTVTKTVHIRKPESNLDWCNGRIPTKDGFITVNWTKDGLTYEVPAGYHVNFNK